jgi:hypothetical protein
MYAIVSALGGFKKETAVRILAVMLALPCSLILYACKDRSYNAKQKTLEPVERKLSLVPVTDFELGFAKREGIPHVVFEDAVTPREEPETTYQFTRVEFPDLSEKNYKKLMGRYGGQGLVPWEQGRTVPYQLEDFLHPKIQALAGRWLKSTIETAEPLPASWRTYIEGEPLVPTISNDMNCWNTSFEVLRDWFTPFAKMTGIVGYIDGSVAGEILLGPKFMAVEQVFQSPDDLGAFSRVSNKDREVGDLLYIHRFPSDMKMDAAHTAIWIDEDLYFDKPNSGDTLPFRIARSREVLEPYLGSEMQFARVRKDAPRFPTQFELAMAEEKGRDPLPEAYRGRITTSQVLSFGGGSSAVALNRLVEFPVKQSVSSRRAEFDGAEKLLRTYPETTIG